jgi:hypothetical protein
MTHKVTDINGITGEQVVRDMNADELAQLELDKASAAVRTTEQAARTAAREALLDRLGITADEAQLLLGGM